MTPKATAKHTLFYGLMCCFLSGHLATPAIARDIVVSKSPMYYALGGGSDVSMPPVSHESTLTVGARVNAHLLPNCDAFKPNVTVRNTLNNIKDSVEGMKRDIINSATSAVATFPLLVLQKANPELYNLLQNAMAHGMDRFHLGLKGCHAAMHDIAQGNNPYAHWFSVSDSEGWIKASTQAANTDAVDVNTVAQDIHAHSGEAGVPWVNPDEHAGGKHQQPLRMISDVVVAGYNVLLGSHRPLNSDSPAPKDSPLAAYWATPKAVAAFSHQVLGEITLKEGKAGDTTAGVGLITLMHTCPDEQSSSHPNTVITCIHTLEDKLTQLVRGQGREFPTADTLMRVSARHLLITPDVLRILKRTAPTTQTVAIQKLAFDVALQNTVDKALFLRRLLLAGLHTPPVQSVAVAKTVVNHALAQLNKDMAQLLFEVNLRQKVGVNALQTLLALGAAHEGQAARMAGQTQRPQGMNGAVYTKDARDNDRQTHP